MNKAERLLHIVTYMRSRRTVVRAAELADRLNVSERTIYRDVQSLVLSGIPIEGEAGIGYLLNSKTSIAPLMFNEDEIDALVLGARLIKAWGDDGMISAADSALTKIRSVISEPLMHKLNHRTTPILVPELNRSEKVKFSDQIRLAINQSKTISIDYSDVKNDISTRELEPLGLIFWGNNWTLVAWCFLRDNYRTFRLDRINDLNLTENTFFETGHSLADYVASFGQEVDTRFWSV